MVESIRCLHAHLSEWSALEYFILTFLTLTLFVKACAIEWRWHSAVRHSCIHSPFSLLSCGLARCDEQLFDFGHGHYAYIYSPSLFVARKNGLFRQPSFPLSFLATRRFSKLSLPSLSSFARITLRIDARATRRYSFVFIDNEVRDGSPVDVCPRLRYILGEWEGFFSRKRPEDITR